MILTQNHRAINRMNGWEILEEAIPRGEVEAIAQLLGYSTDAVRRWRREPEASDEMSTGRRSPLDLLLLLINVVYTRAGDANAGLIVDRVVEEFVSLRRIHGRAASIPPDQIEGALRAAVKTLSVVADQFAEENGNEGIRGQSSTRPERADKTLADKGKGRRGG